MDLLLLRSDNLCSRKAKDSVVLVLVLVLVVVLVLVLVLFLTQLNLTIFPRAGEMRAHFEQNHYNQHSSVAGAAISVAQSKFGQCFKFREKPPE